MFAKNSTIKVSVDKSHLFTLGEKMYRESIEFVRELVTNAYDADATEVLVAIGEDKIIVEDNGSGMNEKGLAQYFTIGSEEKKCRNISPRFGRKRIGQFGIGKFSALALAGQFIVESVKGNYKYAVVFDRADWENSNHWNLPIKKEKATALDREGTRIILDKLTKKISAAETEKYLKQSVPLRAKKFSVYLNNKKISAQTVAGKQIPVKIKTMYGLIEGEIVLALNARDVDEPGIECRVKQVFIRRELFGVESKYRQGINRVAGCVNADFLPLISSRSDFIADTPEYKLFRQLMRAELSKALDELKKQGDAKMREKVTRELEQVMKHIKDALALNPDFVPQGKAVARLKKEGRKKLAPLASAEFSQKKGPDSVQKDAPEKNDKAEEPDKAQADEKKEDKPEKIKIAAKPLAVKRIRINNLGISVSIVSLGEEGREVISQGNIVYVNQDHPLYGELYKKRELLAMHLLRLITQEIVLMKKKRISAEEAFEWQGKLLRDALCENKA